ncbi:MAG TPA: hypothetical protein DHV29_00975 [Bacteroidales bacterium]|nr:MAG: hypothetical protein A2W94_13870 [Bacteroidetes bacterium GWE2_42_42]HCB63298.1 hypothetical protein [Bacteroidales bacterium]HCY22040.1 hypothetical protein [Bacteroidales bacterium]
MNVVLIFYFSHINVYQSIVCKNRVPQPECLAERALCVVDFSEANALRSRSATQRGCPAIAGIQQIF